MRGASLFCSVWLAREKNEIEKRRKKRIQAKTNVSFERKKERNKKTNENARTHTLFWLVFVRRRTRWLKNDSQRERKKMFVFNRDAVRELRRQLARVVALLSDDKERVVRLVSYMRRGQTTIGGGGGASLSSVKNEVIQSAAATSATTSNNNNTDDESNSMQLSAVDCGEWLLGRVLSALLFLADKNNENNNDDDDANDDDGEKKATNEVRGFLLAAGVDEATVEQTVKELNWKVRVRNGRLFCCCAPSHTHAQT